MNALDFAEEFISDLPDLLKEDYSKHLLNFSIGVYEKDPDLKILRSELNKIGYDLIAINQNKIDKITDQDWQLIKL